MGIFFLIININDEGDLYGSLQIANTVVNSKQFMYSLEVRLNNWNTSYKGNVRNIIVLHYKHTPTFTLLMVLFFRYYQVEHLNRRVIKVLYLFPPITCYIV